MEQEIVMMGVDEVIPYEHNPRKNKDAVEYVANSIKEFGFKQPIVVDKNNIIIVGHTRLLAAKKLGIKEVPVLVADDLSEEQAKAYRLADNKTNEFAEWDNGELQGQLDELYGLIDMSNFGFAVQIENIDMLGEEEGQGQMEFATELDEANNYIVLQFKSNTDWEKAVELFDLKVVQTHDKNEKVRRHGIGRAIDGGEILGWFENED